MIPETLEKLAVPVASLRPYGRNPRLGDVALIVASLRRHGQYRPIVVNARTSEVLAGNHTLRAAQELGWDEIAATFVDVDEDTAARIVLVDNRSNDQAAYDDQALTDLLESLPDLEGTGYDGAALDGLLAALAPPSSFSGDTEPADVPEVPRTACGDLYLLAEHRLLCGDSTNRGDVERLMSGSVAQLVFTDPPYGVDYDGGTKKRERLVGDQRGSSIYAEVLPVIRDVSDDKAPLYLWHAGAVAASVYSAIVEADYEVRAQIIWVKNMAQFGALSAQYKQKHEPALYCFKRGTAPRWHGPTNEVTVWEYARASVNEFHPTQKPVELAERALENSTERSHVVLDLFGGSGSTLIAATNKDRRAYLMEIDPGYCDVIVDRWERHTGSKAEVIHRAEAVEAHA